ncbi:hypothetical protein Mesil_0279 [Allomeiothermus silvanus DSM 9946]|uniref:PIN domain-containing protein n=1 Tax=Allomeiothermus silvanus (strain ATCC 700542 / DSM 9946 / NBRC 106475 / NCIMB 13440 / VI-R2) TaxID=526227 RepID=D7BHI3_ALLS1|nr:PIN domain-containing protein [Allomeiothermus silvanus]ADH62221.1 hypothetical protein Mesil_0279 [Allomeiothermus silvanus DSM 9946]
MIRVLLDTEVLYAHAVPSDQLHRRAQEEQEVLWGQGYAGMVLYPTLLETQRRILQRTYPQFAQAWFEAVLEELNPINPDAQAYRDAAKLLRNYPDQKITLHDAALAIVSRDLAIPAWTFDHHLELMGAQIWPN